MFSNPVFIIIVAIILLDLQSVLRKFYNGESPLFLSFCVTFVALIFFLVLSKFKLSFDKELWKYCIAFGVSFGCSVVFSTLSLQLGDMSLTGLVTSFSLIIPTLYGIVFLKNNVSLFFYIGITLLAIAIILINYKFHNKHEHIKKNINVKWIIFICIAFIGNGLCSTFQTMQQIAYSGTKKSELMVVSLAIACVMILILSLMMERKNILSTLKSSLLLGGTCGLCNGIVNLSTLTLVSLMDVSVMYPLISGGGLVLTFVFGRLFFREKYSVLQYVGFVISIFSVVLLNM